MGSEHIKGAGLGGGMTVLMQGGDLRIE